MNSVNKKLLLVLIYSLCAASFVAFVWGLARFFSALNMHGFKLTEYWALAVVGLAFSLTAAVYSLFKLIALLFGIRKDLKKERQKEKSALNLALNAEDSGVDEQKNADAEADAEPVSEVKEDRKAARARRRRERLLKESKRRVPSGAFGLVMVILVTALTVFYSCWLFFPSPICFHNYIFNESVNGKIDSVGGEIFSYKFYQDYLGRPYYIHTDVESERAFRIPLESKIMSSDEVGDYVLYTFYGEERFAKILDAAMDKHSELTVKLEIKYYKKDSHIVVSHYAKKVRVGKVTEYERSGKVYSFKPLAD